MPPFELLARIAEQEVERAQRGLPSALLEESLKIPVTLEGHPPVDDNDPDPLEPDTLGLFVGEAFPDFGQDLLPLPAQIILFLENIWGFAEQDERTYRREVRKTYLHELGHYLGLDEDALYEREME